MKQYLEIGRIINKRGISGELKLECLCDSPSVIKDIKILYLDDQGSKSCKALSIKDYKGCLYIKLEGITTPDEADKLRGKYLYANRGDIAVDENSIFIADLIGLEVKDADTGKIYGKVMSVENYGASNIYVIKDGKSEYLLPENDDIVVEIKLNEHILVRPIPGIFDDAEEIR